jgi:hypothetical protein
VWDDRRAEHEANMLRLRGLLTSPQQLEAVVPEPLAFQEIKARKANPPNVYNRELRNPIWAPAMEAAVSTFLRDVVVEHFPGLTTEVECRTSTCRVTLRASEQLAGRLNEKYPPNRRDFAIVLELSGAIGPLGRVLRETMMEDGSVSIVFAFDADGMVPGGYRGWQKRVTDKTRANLARRSS